MISTFPNFPCSRRPLHPHHRPYTCRFSRQRPVSPCTPSLSKAGSPFNLAADPSPRIHHRCKLSAHPAYPLVVVSVCGRNCVGLMRGRPRRSNTVLARRAGVGSVIVIATNGAATAAAGAALVVAAYGRLGFVEKDDACNENEPTLRWGTAANGYRMTKCLETLDVLSA